MPLDPSPQSSSPADSPAGTGDVHERRRLLLKGLGKGSAVVAVMVPIQSLAQTQPLGARLCTVSGVHSNVGSGRTGGTTTNCQGYVPSYFATLANWPGYVPASGSTAAKAKFVVNGTNYSNSSKFNAVFGSGSSTTLQNVITSASASASDKIWTAALLSALKKKAAGLGPTASSSRGYFPYTPEEVVALFGSTRKADAETFFRDYLQNAP